MILVIGSIVIAICVVGGFSIWVDWNFETAHDGHTPLSHMIFEEECTLRGIFEWIPDACADFQDYVLDPMMHFFKNRLNIIGKILIIPIWFISLIGFIIEYSLVLIIQIPILVIIFTIKGIYKLLGLIFLKNTKK